ncbi:MAG TPA: formate dehydrogenase accessory protein FdhE [Candidatus Dormibacteraeota bacterium]|nr:formate dehydrogenase accessory protein FdhE [Candidatus Dormibacteraeota bacterium]
MPISLWQRRIQRAHELTEQRPFAAEMLRFYIAIANFQEQLHRRLNTALPPKSRSSSIASDLSPQELSELCPSFPDFLSVAQRHGPAPLTEISNQLRARGESFWSELLQEAWRVSAPSDAEGFLVQAFLQPYAELLRSHSSPEAAQGKYASCPFCHRKPGFGVMRQMGEGAARSLICSFCLAEWNFRRLVCPGCGEENDRTLPVYTASDFDYIRVECCDTCKTYLKAIDLTKNGHAEPVVDELASAPLDLWAHEHGYAKLRPNLLGM